MSDDARSVHTGPTSPSDEIFVNTGKGSITLDQLGQTQKGMAHWMADIAERISNCWHAAHGGNWELSSYYLRTATKLMRHSVVLRPVYREDMESFIREDCPRVTAAVKDKDLEAFDEAFERMLSRANEYHDKWNFGYIRSTVPTGPPNVDLDFSGG